MDTPGWFDWPDLYERVVASIPDGAEARFVELGTFCGRSACFMGALLAQHHARKIEFDTWDDWSGVPGSSDFSPAQIEGHARMALAPYIGIVRQRVGDCLLDAPRVYADGSLDFVFLDDDHSEDHVLAECRAWWPKVKAGGLLAGHDYDFESVWRAVGAWSREVVLPVERVSARCWGVRRP